MLPAFLSNEEEQTSTMQRASMCDCSLCIHIRHLHACMQLSMHRVTATAAPTCTCGMGAQGRTCGA